MQVEVISFNLCPFVQQVIIALTRKNVEHWVKYIDLSAPPIWFHEITPFATVPVLVIDDRAVAQTIAIQELIEELFSGKWYPGDPISRSHHRSWLLHLNEAMFLLKDATIAKDPDTLDIVVARISRVLNQIEEVLPEGADLFSSSYSYVDAALAPFFQRLDILGEVMPDQITAMRTTKIERLWRNLVSDEALAKATPPDFRRLYLQMIANRNGYLGELVSNKLQIGSTRHSEY